MLCSLPGLLNHSHYLALLLHYPYLVLLLSHLLLSFSFSDCNLDSDLPLEQKFLRQSPNHLFTQYGIHRGYLGVQNAGETLDR